MVHLGQLKNNWSQYAANGLMAKQYLGFKVEKVHHCEDEKNNVLLFYVLILKLRGHYYFSRYRNLTAWVGPITVTER